MSELIETIWLTQPEATELFQMTKHNVSSESSSESSSDSSLLRVVFASIL